MVRCILNKCLLLSLLYVVGYLNGFHLGVFSIQLSKKTDNILDVIQVFDLVQFVFF